MLLFVDSQFLSPYAMSSFVALREKNLHFELRTIHLHLQENRGSEFSTLSLTSRVPTLADGDYSISESSAISEYAEKISLAANLPSRCSTAWKGTTNTGMA
jgi:glutathione S-transferase